MSDTRQAGNTSSQGSPISDLKDGAQKLASGALTSAQDTVKQAVEDRKGLAADQVDEVGRALDKAADAVEHALPPAGGVVRQVASSVHDASSLLRDRGVDELLGLVIDFGRRRPGTFVAGAALAGFAVARLLKSSADQQRALQAQHASQGPVGAGFGGVRPMPAHQPPRPANVTGRAGSASPVSRPREGN